MVRNRKENTVEDDELENTDDVNIDDENEQSNEKDKPKYPIQIVEREINLSLLNDKINFIISLLTKKD